MCLLHKRTQKSSLLYLCLPSRYLRKSEIFLRSPSLTRLALFHFSRNETKNRRVPQLLSWYNPEDRRGIDWSTIYKKLASSWEVASPALLKKMYSRLSSANYSKKEAMEALASVLDTRAEYSEQVAPLRALLLLLIYPDMSLAESETYLRQDGYSDKLISKSNLLVRLVGERAAY